MKRLLGQREVSIGTILNIYAIVLTLLPVMIVVMIAVSLFAQQARQQATNQLEALAETKQQEIKRWLENGQTILQLILTNPEQYRRMSDILLSGAPQPAKAANVTNFLQSQLELQSSFQELFLYNLEGRVLVSTDVRQVEASLRTQQQPYVDKGLQNLTIQAPYYDPSRGEMTALILEPVYHSSGSVLGVLVGRLNLTTLANIMTTRVGLGESGETYLIGRERANFITPSRFVVNEPRQSYHSVGIEAALKQQNGAGFYEDYRGVEVIGVYRWLPELEAALLAEINTAEALQAISWVQQISFIVAVGAVGVAFGVGVSMTRWITRPIQKLTQVAGAIMEGDYEQQADVTVKNEVGQLAKAFNTMTTQLRELIYSLEERVEHRTQELAQRNQLLAAQNSILTTVSQSLDLPTILQAALDQTLQVTQMGGGAIYLVTEQRQLQLQVHQGLAEGYVQAILMLNWGEGITGRAIAQKELVMLPLAEFHTSRLFPVLQQHGVKLLVSVPFMVKGEAIGGLSLASYVERELMATDIELLNNVAKQIGVGVENARLYQLLQGANQALTRLNADKDRFFSIVAHDLKGPFMPLLGNAELLTEMGDILPPQEIKQLGASIQRTAKNVFSLLENLLAWARLQMGRMEYNPQRLDLNEIAAKTVELLSGNAEAKQIKLRNEVSVGTWVYADENMVDTVIRNLTNNALKFTPSGGEVRIGCRELGLRSQESVISHSQFPIPNYVEVSIADTGVGMPPEVQEKLFKIDQHVTTVGTGKETGTGLGLIICQEMVVKSGGRIWVESEVGKGTTVRFTVRLDKM